MAKQAVATRIDLDPIDRLEEKVRTLVSIVTQLRADHARVTEENGRLARELDNTRSRGRDSSGLLVPTTGFCSAMPWPIAHANRALSAARALAAEVPPLSAVIFVTRIATSRRVI